MKDSMVETKKCNETSIFGFHLEAGMLPFIKLDICGRECNEQTYQSILNSLRLCAALVISGLEPCI
jgi:hypothetical protein